MAVVVLEPAELEAMLARAAELGAERALARAGGAASDPILSAEEAAREAGVSPKTIGAWARSGRLRAGAPPYRIRRSDLLAAVAGGRRPTAANAEPEDLADAALERARRRAP
jgi:hypothetical protein